MGRTCVIGDTLSSQWTLYVRSFISGKDLGGTWAARCILQSRGQALDEIRARCWPRIARAQCGQHHKTLSLYPHLTLELWGPLEENMLQPRRCGSREPEGSTRKQERGD